MGKIDRIIIVCGFLFTLFFFMLGTIAKTDLLLVDNLRNFSNKDISNVISNTEQILQDHFLWKRALVNVHGLTLKLFKKSIVGNFEFAKDNFNQVHVLSGQYFVQPFINQLYILNEKVKLSQSKAKLVYVQIPSKFSQNSQDLLASLYDYDNQSFDEVIKNLQNKNIITLDYRCLEKKSKNSFFKTDVHMTTGAEWDLMMELIHILEEKCELTFGNKNAILNKNNYTILNKKFLGNCAYSVGKYFVGTDIFELYYPNFPTNLTLYDSSGTVLRQGSFEEVVMNGYDKLNNSEYLYWVTNFMQFGKPCYEYINNNISEGPEILIDMDSLGYRLASYLTLMCKKITVIDSRYDQNGGYMAAKLLNNQYDAVIVLQKNSLMPTTLVGDFINDPQAEIVLQNAPTTINNRDQYAFGITVKNTSKEAWSNRKNIKLCIWVNGIDYGYRLLIPDGIEIEPDEKYTFLMNGFKAPPLCDSFFIEFQMLQEGITYFGEKERVEVSVVPGL